MAGAQNPDDILVEVQPGNDMRAYNDQINSPRMSQRSYNSRSRYPGPNFNSMPSKTEYSPLDTRKSLNGPSSQIKQLKETIMISNLSISRRSFLRKAILTVTATSTLPHWYQEELSAMPQASSTASAIGKPNVALIGCGGMGRYDIQNSKHIRPLGGRL